MYRIGDIEAAISTTTSLMISKLRSLQNTDGGFKGYYCHDEQSGVWSTAEIVHLVAKGQHRNSSQEWLSRACRYLADAQNTDGGWPFRKPGKSITDITAWCCLALNHFGYEIEVKNGIRFILLARTNEHSASEDGWGLTRFESDRVYSTWIASYCLYRLLSQKEDLFSAEERDEISTAVREAKFWLISIRKTDSSWGPASNFASHYTATAVALLTLFIQGVDPREYTASYDFLRSGSKHGLWAAEEEIVVTQEGYELPQQWFTSALVFRALIFFAELNIAELDELDKAFTSLIALVQGDGRVKADQHGHADFIWTIPYMIDALEKYLLFINSKHKAFGVFLERKRQHAVETKRRLIEHRLIHEFPYPISESFSKFQHELEYYRRFQLLIQLYEVMIKYAAVVGLSGYLLGKEANEGINGILAGNFKRPSLGDWARLLEASLKDSAGFGKLLSPISGSDVLKGVRGSLEEGSGKGTLSQALSHIVALRNANSGHGAMRTAYEYKQTLELEESNLYSLLERLMFLALSNSFLVLASEYDEFGEGDRYKIRIFKGLNITDDDLETSNRLSEGQRDTMVRYIYFQNTTSFTIANLYPFLSYMFCEECKHEHFFFFNGLRDSDRVTYLSYSCGHIAEKANSQHLRKRLLSCGVAW